MIKTPTDLHSCIKNLQANVFVADKDFNLVYMNAHARKTLEAIEPKIQEVFQLNVDDMQGGSIHRFHRDPKSEAGYYKTRYDKVCKIPYNTP